MKAFLPFFIFLLSFTANAQNAEWIRSISSISTAGSEANDGASHHFVDSKGNIYLVGTFRGAWLHIGTTTLTNTLASYSEIFIIKYDSLGAVLWARSIKGHNSEILVDAELDTFDNLYLAGSYNSSTLDFDGQMLPMSAGQSDIFIAKYTPDGTVAWAKSAGGGEYEEPSAIATDQNGNLFITGWYQSKPMTIGGFTIDNTFIFGKDVFIAKYDPAGNVLWVKSSQGTYEEVSRSIVVDGSGEVIVSGYFSQGSFSFSNIVLQHKDRADLFMVKYSDQGQIRWAKAFGGEMGETPWELTVDKKGNTYCSGTTNSTSISFDSHTISMQVSGFDFNHFLYKISPSGKIEYAKGFPVQASAWSFDHQNDPEGNVYVTGSYYSETFDIDAIPLHKNNSLCSGLQCADMFVARFDTSGVVSWAKSFTGNQADNPTILTYHKGDIYIAGTSSSNALTLDEYTLNNMDNELFLLRLNDLGYVEWAKSASGSSSNIYPRSLDVSNANSIYVSGEFYLSGSVLDGLPFTYVDYSDVFLVKFSFVSDLIHPRTVCVDDTVVVDLTATASNLNINFDDGSVPTTTSVVPQKVVWHTPGLKNIHATYMVNGQPAELRSIIIVKPSPVAYISGDSLFCAGDSSLLSTLTQSGYEYKWFRDDAIIPDENSFTYAKVSGIYKVSIDLDGCISRDTLRVRQVPLPSPLITYANDSICYGESVTLTASENGTYLWSDASQTKSINVSSSGSYSVTVTDTVGCKGVSPSVVITVVPRVLGFFSNHQRIICTDEPVELATGKIGTHTWSTGETSTSVLVKEPGTYWVEVADGICPIVRDSVLILRDATLFIPNLVTPNNDGNNDAVYISDYSGKKSIIIYNRWGEKVFEDAEYENNFVPYQFQNQILYFTVKAFNQCGDKETTGWIHIVGTP